MHSSTGLHLNAYSSAPFPNQIEVLLIAVSNFVRNVSGDTTSLVRIPAQTLQDGSKGKSPQRLITKNTINTYGRVNVRLRRFHILNLCRDKLPDSSSGWFTTIKNPIAVLRLVSDFVGRKTGFDSAFGESQSAICRYSNRSLVTTLSYFGSWKGPWPSFYHLPFIQRDIAPGPKGLQSTRITDGEF
jgi:hypothetical protein